MVVAALRLPTVATSEVMVSKVVRDMTVAKIRATMTTDATSPAEGIAHVPRQKYARDVQAFEVAPTVRFPGRSPRLQHFVLAQIVTKAPRQAKENEARKSRRIAMALRISAFVGLVLGFYTRNGVRWGAPRRRGAVHVTGVFILPTCERFSE
jgi:hypothetical protein